VPSDRRLFIFTAWGPEDRLRASEAELDRMARSLRVAEPPPLPPAAVWQTSVQFIGGTAALLITIALLAWYFRRRGARPQS
jgi:hypothetical protein